MIILVTRTLVWGRQLVSLSYKIIYLMDLITHGEIGTLNVGGGFSNRVY